MRYTSRAGQSTGEFSAGRGGQALVWAASVARRVHPAERGGRGDSSPV